LSVTGLQLAWQGHSSTFHGKRETSALPWFLVIGSYFMTSYVEIPPLGEHKGLRGTSWSQAVLSWVCLSLFISFLFYETCSFTQAPQPPG